METAKQSVSMSVAELRKYVKDKRDLYLLAVRNEYYLPSMKSSCCSEEFITDVLQGRCWCPKVGELRLKPCLQPPSVEILIGRVMKAAKSANKELMLTPEKPPNVKWLVDVLALLKPDDEIFKKDYVPPPRIEKIADAKTVNFPMELFKGLPESRSKSKQCRLKLIGEATGEGRILRLKRQQKRISDALLEEQVKLDERRSSKKREMRKSAEEVKTADPNGKVGGQSAKR